MEQLKFSKLIAVSIVDLRWDAPAQPVASEDIHRLLIDV
jgi:hypothetical protein